MASKKVAVRGLITTKSNTPPISPLNLDLNSPLSPGSMSVNEIILLSPTRKVSADCSPRKSPFSFSSENVFFGSHDNSFLRVEQDKLKKSQPQCKVAGEDQIYHQLNGYRSPLSSTDPSNEQEEPSRSGPPLLTTVPKNLDRPKRIVLEESNIVNEDPYPRSKFYSNLPGFSAISVQLNEDEKKSLGETNGITMDFDRPQELIKLNTSPKYFSGNKTIRNMDGAFSSSQEMPLPRHSLFQRTIVEEGCTSKHGWKEDVKTAAVDPSAEQGNSIHLSRDSRPSQKSREKKDLPFLSLPSKSQEKPPYFCQTLKMANREMKDALSCRKSCNLGSGKSKLIVGELELEDIETREENVPQTECTFVHDLDKALKESWRMDELPEKCWETQKHLHQRRQLQLQEQLQQQQQQQQRLENLWPKQPQQVAILELLSQKEFQHNSNHSKVEVSSFPKKSDLENNVLLNASSEYPPRDSSVMLADIPTPIELEAHRRYLRRQQQKEQNRKNRDENSLFD